MNFKGFNLLRIHGIQVTIDYSWFILFFIVIYAMAEGYFPHARAEYSVAQYWAMGVVAAVLLFVSVLLHELAHSFVALKQGIDVTRIRLFFFGGVAQISREPRSGRHEFLIAIAGPAMSMLLTLIFAAVSMVFYVAQATGPVAPVAGFLASANLALALFNLIPGLPLDGGRILRAILWDRWNDVTRATKIASRMGNIFALLLIFWGMGFFVLTQSIIGLLNAFVGVFMKFAATSSYQAVVLKESLGGVPIRQIMTEKVVTVDRLIPVDELVRDYIYKYKFTHFPVFDHGELVGMVSLDQVKSVPKELWGFKQVRDIMDPIEQVPQLKPADDATDALNRMISEDQGRMPVVEDGRLVGIVSRRDILNLFKIKSDLGAS